jgi:hypothetical protein
VKINFVFGLWIFNFEVPYWLCCTLFTGRQYNSLLGGNTAFLFVLRFPPCIMLSEETSESEGLGVGQSRLSYVSTGALDH